MGTVTNTKTMIPNGIDPRVLARLVEEGYGPGAWHGADLKAAVVDVSAELAFWRPAPGRHNIAEIALHHAYHARSVRGQLSGATPEPFVLEGDDWFALPGESTLSWKRICEVLDSEQQRLAATISKLTDMDAESLDIVLGITCHAVYHAGQVQLIKKLHDG